VNEIVNAMLGLGEEIKESVIVRKLLRSLPMRFDPKISMEHLLPGSDCMDGELNSTYFQDEIAWMRMHSLAVRMTIARVWIHLYGIEVHR
jgi:hypothetical protein